MDLFIYLLISLLLIVLTYLPTLQQCAVRSETA